MMAVGLRLRRIAMASTALVALPMIAAAQDATWTGPGTTLTNGTNWSGGAVPTGTGTFAAPGPANPTLPRTTSFDLGSMVFSPGAQAYSITLEGVRSSVVLNQGGIVNDSGRTQTFLMGPQTNLILTGTASAGSGIVIRGTEAAPGAASVILRDSATGGTARVENATLTLRGSASADRMTLSNGIFSAIENATLANATVDTAGASSIQDRASLGAATITILPGGVLTAVGNSTGGTAAITVQRNAELRLFGLTAPTFTIGSLAGDGRVTLGERTLVLNGPGSSFGGVFEGTSGGGVTFASGVNVLTGTSTLTGNLLVNPGASLFVDGDTRTAGTTFVDAGGTLGGTGTVGRVFLSGVLSPGNAATPVGTLTVAGNLAMDAGSTVRVDVTSSGADRINVSGTAVLDGTLQVVPGTAPPANGQVFTIVQAGRVQGTFAGVTDNLAYFDFTPAYTGTQVNLVATQLPFSTPTVTNGVRNLTSKGSALDTYVAAVASTQQRNADFDAVLLELLRSPTASQATAALHSLSGESYAAFTSVGLEQMDRFRYAALDAAGGCEGRGGEMRGRWCAWADAYYVSANLDGSGDLAGFDYTLSGVQGGAETRLRPDAVVGFTLGYGNQRMRNFDFASRRITGDALFAGVYGTYGMGPWQVAGLLGYARFDVNGERDITVGSIGRQAQSNFGADAVNAALALRYRVDVGGFRIEPEALLAFTQYWQDGFTETGAGSLNLQVGSSDANSFVTGIGVRASTELTLGGRMVRPFAVLRYEHDWLAGAKEDHRITASFAQVPEAGSWTVFGQNRGQENLIGRLGVIGEITSNVALFGTVGGQLNSNGSEWGVGGGLRVVF